MGRTLGIDYGERRVGVAISDPLGSIAFGLCTLEVNSLAKAVVEVSQTCREKEVETVVVGLPLNMDGSHGPMADKVQEFVDELQAETGLTVVTYDERLSSAAAERTLLDADMSRRKRKGVIDKMAAQVILQGYLDQQSFMDDSYEPL